MDAEHSDPSTAESEEDEETSESEEEEVDDGSPQSSEAGKNSVADVPASNATSAPSATVASLTSQILEDLPQPNSTSKESASDSDSDESGSGSEEEESSTDDGSESDSASSTNSDSSGAESEEGERLLQYQRLRLPPAIFEHEFATALKVFDRFIVIGTDAGSVVALDFWGQEMRGKFIGHNAEITELSVDASGDFVAACSMDGKVSVWDVFADSSAPIFTHTFSGVMRSIALAPDYASAKKKTLICGGNEGVVWRLTHPSGRVRLFGGVKTVALHSGEGRVFCVSWRGRLVTWANDVGVKIYDVNAGQRITRVDRPADAPRADLCRCVLTWVDDNSLIIGWGHSIKLCRVKPRPQHELAADPTLPALCGVVEATWYLPESYICGVAPYNERLVLVAFSEPYADDASGTAPSATMKRGYKAPPPVMHVTSSKGEVLTSDYLNIDSFESLRPTHYRLAINENLDVPENTFYILAPTEVVIARESTMNDHIRHYLNRKKLVEALECTHAAAAGKPCSHERSLGPRQTLDITPRALAEMVVQEFMKESKWEEAAKIVPTLCGTDGEEWKDWFYRFFGVGQLALFVAILPTEPVLAKPIYALSLSFLLDYDPAALLSAVKRWPPEIYDVKAVIKCVSDKINLIHEQKAGLGDPALRLRQEVIDGVSDLSAALALLYEASGDTAKALHLHLQNRHPAVFDFIERHKDYEAALERLPYLMRMTPEAATRACAVLKPHAAGNGILSVSSVVDRLSKDPADADLLYAYLTSLLDSSDADVRACLNRTDLHDLIVSLMARLNPSALPDFLEKSEYVSFDHALRVLEGKDPSVKIDPAKPIPLQAVVFCLGRCGRTEDALRIILHRDVKNPRSAVAWAVRFIKDSDESLFPLLVSQCVRSENLTGALLDTLVSVDGAWVVVDPLSLLSQVPDSLNIQGLRDKIVRLLRDRSYRVSLRGGALDLLRGDVVQLQEQFVYENRMGTFVDVSTARCNLCGSTLPPAFDISPFGVRTMPATSRSKGVVVFHCRHRVHADCLKVRSLDHVTVVIFVVTYLDVVARLLHTAAACQY